MPEPMTVEQDGDDFLFVLEPGLYWFVVRSNRWNSYRRALKYAWGKEAFKTVHVQEKTVRVDAFGSRRRVKATFVVLDVREPIMVSATIMGAPHEYEEGDDAQSVGAFEVPEPHWILGAEEYRAQALAWVEGSIEELKELPDEAFEFAKEKGEHLAEMLSTPGEWLDEVQSKAFQIAALFVVAGLGALAVYRVTTD